MSRYGIVQPPMLDGRCACTDKAPCGLHFSQMTQASQAGWLKQLGIRAVERTRP
jgi:hypothetical protein